MKALRYIRWRHRVRGASQRSLPDLQKDFAGHLCYSFIWAFELMNGETHGSGRRLRRVVAVARVGDVDFVGASYKMEHPAGFSLSARLDAAEQGFSAVGW